MPHDLVGANRLGRRLRAVQRRLGICAAAAGNAILGQRLRDAFGILLYHRVTPRIPGVATPTWNVTPDRLRRQMEGLLGRGYEPWPLRQVLAFRRQRRPVPRKVFVVTFDDGYDSVYRNAWPIFKELKIPATVFLATRYLDSDTPFPFEDWPAAGLPRLPASSWKPLTRRQCAQMQAGGLFELGTHTHLHEDFRGRPEALRRDLLDSLRAMRELFGVEDPAFSLPFGFHEPELAAVARNAGVPCGLTCEREPVTPESDPFHWGRFAVEQRDTAATLAAQLSGWYSVLRGGWQWWPRLLRGLARRRVRGAGTVEPSANGEGARSQANVP